MEADPATHSTCPGCIGRDRRIAELEARVAALEAVIEQLRRGGKRQAAPFSKGPPKADPKKPGRKSGNDYGTKARRGVPPRIDEVHEAKLPSSCPGCGSGCVEHDHTSRQYQAEIPRRVIYRQFNVQVGHCRCCGKRLQGRHALQTSDALGAAASQLGPDAQAAAAHLNKSAGLSHGKVRAFFHALFGIQVSRSGVCQAVLRAGKKAKGNSTRSPPTSDAAGTWCPTRPAGGWAGIRPGCTRSSRPTPQRTRSTGVAGLMPPRRPWAKISPGR